MRYFVHRLLAWLALLAVCAPLSAAAASERDDQVMARRATAELKAVLSLKLKPRQEVVALIMQERFGEFEALSREYEKKFRNDPKYEFSLISLYSSLDDQSDSLLAKLDKWVAARPSDVAHAARGIYKRFRGYAARGEKSRNETTQAQFDRMKELHEQAIPDLLIALKANKRLSPAYVSLIAIQRGAGDTMSAERTVAEAVRWIPETYHVRRAYLVALRPRWGGDYSLMQAYANSIDETTARLNPRLWTLKAEVPAELGYSAWASRDYADAIKYYTEALRYGDQTELLKNRGRIFMNMRQYAEARRDLARYTEYDRSDEEVNRWIKSLDQVK